MYTNDYVHVWALESVAIVFENGPNPPLFFGKNHSKIMDNKNKICLLFTCLF